MYDDIVSRTVSNPYKSSAEQYMSVEQITVFLQKTTIENHYKTLHCDIGQVTKKLEAKLLK